mgnify:CR=1 FL=1
MFIGVKLHKNKQFQNRQGGIALAKILIIEDEMKIARFLELELKHEGYEVLIAGDGRLGLEKALKENVDLIILDIMLPDIDGYQLLKEIKLKISNFALIYVPSLQISASGNI